MFDRLRSLQEYSYGLERVEKFVGDEVKLSFDRGPLLIVNAAPIVEPLEVFWPPGGLSATEFKAVK